MNYLNEINYSRYKCSLYTLLTFLTKIFKKADQVEKLLFFNNLATKENTLKCI